MPPGGYQIPVYKANHIIIINVSVLYITIVISYALEAGLLFNFNALYTISLSWPSSNSIPESRYRLFIQSWPKKVPTLTAKLSEKFFLAITAYSHFPVNISPSIFRFILNLLIV